MTKMLKRFDFEAVKILKEGGVGVMPTDTIYGIVCSALSKKSVNEVYHLRKRSPDKPVIVLIGSKLDVRMFGIKLEPKTSNILNRFWPGPVSVILHCESKKFLYLHRGKKAIAFRVPADAALRRFLNKTGPLIAPSANFESEPPAKTTKEAKKYFGNKVGFYIDGGKFNRNPSKVISIKDGEIFVIRK